MAHFAEIDARYLVRRVIVVDNNILLNKDGEEEEHLGSIFCSKLFGGTWVQTSYNANFRGFYAYVGCKYNPATDEFEHMVGPVLPEWSPVTE